jgi:hypothetical protein
VQWQVSTNGGTTFSNLSGATSTTLTLNNVQGSQAGSEYRAVFTNSAGSATSTAATLTVTIALSPGDSNPPPPLVGGIQDQTVVAGFRQTPWFYGPVAFSIGTKDETTFGIGLLPFLVNTFPGTDPADLESYVRILRSRISVAVQRAAKRMGPRKTWQGTIWRTLWTPDSVLGTISAEPDSSAWGGYKLNIQVNGKSRWAKTLNGELEKVTSLAPL